MKQFDKVVATFTPQKTIDLKKKAIPWVGRTLEWEALWIIEDGEYAGQWAMGPNIDHRPFPPFTWAPLCDLTIAK